MTTAEDLRQGDVRLLETGIAQRLLASAIPARLAFVAKDGTPRVTPINFHWNGTELVMSGFAPSLKVKALRANPNVAITIDTDAQPPEVLLIRGRAEITEQDGLVPEYELALPGGFAAAPQGNVTQASHKHVTKQNPPSPNVTNTFNSGEAEQS